MATEILESVKRQARDVRAAAQTLSHREARYLVDSYYMHQEMRIRALGQARAMAETNEPHAVITWLEVQSTTLEDQLKGALDRYTNGHPVGKWMRGIRGIGPVIAAGFLANLDITKSNTAGKLWAYCGLAPGQKRTRGQKLGYNPSLKRLAFLTGESFKRLSPDDERNYYRRVYDTRKAFEQANNDAGVYAEQAKKILTEKKFGDDTKAKTFYEAGKLPPGHIDRRSARYATKLFLAHLHAKLWEHEFGESLDPAKRFPPVPYAIAHLGHVDLIPPPD